MFVSTSLLNNVIVHQLTIPERTEQRLWPKAEGGEFWAWGEKAPTHRLSSIADSPHHQRARGILVHHNCSCRTGWTGLDSLEMLFWEVQYCENCKWGLQLVYIVTWSYAPLSGRVDERDSLKTGPDLSLSLIMWRWSAIYPSTRDERELWFCVCVWVGDTIAQNIYTYCVPQGTLLENGPFHISGDCFWMYNLRLPRKNILIFMFSYRYLLLALVTELSVHVHVHVRV